MDDALNRDNRDNRDNPNPRRPENASKTLTQRCAKNTLCSHTTLLYRYKFSRLLFDDCEDLGVRHGIRSIQALLEFQDVPILAFSMG